MKEKKESPKAEKEIKPEVEQESQQEEVESIDEAQLILEENLRFYNKGREVPQDALKKIGAGRLRGMSDINPMWRMKRLTEIFGPCGFGWTYQIEKQWCEQYGDEVKCFCNVLLYVKDPDLGMWSKPIPGSGGASIVSKEKSGLYVNDEGYKMALTDALSIAMKPLGIGADIWYGEKASGHNESKYEEYTQQNQQASQPIDYTKITTQAITKIKACKTLEEVTACWQSYAHDYPQICQNGSQFYNAAAQAIQTLRQQ